MSRYSIEESSLTAIADAVRELRQENDPLTPAEIVEKIDDSWLGYGIPFDKVQDYDEEWTRPLDWPNLDSIEIEDDFDGVYLSYDLRKTPDYGWISVRIMAATSLTAYFDRGHLENGVFVVDESFSVNGSASNGSTFRQDLDEENGTVQLWRVTCNKPITRFFFCTSSATNSKSIAAKLQPCVEAAGQLLYVTSLSADNNYDYRSNYYSYATFWMEKDSRAVKGPITSLGYTWQAAFNLKVLDVSKWDTSSANVTSMRSTWSACRSLCQLDLSTWDTSGWTVTTLQDCWSGCRELTKLIIDNWDTSNWAVTTLSYCWASCVHLNSLNLSGWNTSNWAVTSLGNTWDYCFRLQVLDVGTWDTSNWAVTTLAYCWRNCRSLIELPIGNWNTENWVVTSLANTFVDLICLTELPISGWDTSKWAVTTLNSCFYGCRSLREIDLNSWDTSNWSVTGAGLENTFEYCWIAKSIRISAWDTSNWTITSIRYLFAYCYMLEEIDVSGWDPAGWIFGNSGTGYFTTDCFHLRRLIGFKNWSCFNTTTGTMSITLQMLEDCDGLPYKTNLTLTDCISLTRESLVDILTALPSVTTTTKITLNYNNFHKLTPEEIAIATNKGWTVA